MTETLQIAPTKPHTSIVTLKTIVRERDGYKCVDCGMTQHVHVEQYGKQLDVHRLVPGAVYDDEHCVTVCRPCHRKRHAVLRSKKLYRAVRLDAYANKLARILAAYEDRALSDLISEIVESVLVERLDKAGIPYPKRPAPES